MTIIRRSKKISFCYAMYARRNRTSMNRVCVLTTMLRRIKVAGIRNAPRKNEESRAAIRVWGLSMKESAGVELGGFHWRTTSSE